MTAQEFKADLLQAAWRVYYMKCRQKAIVPADTKDWKDSTKAKLQRAENQLSDLAAKMPQEVIDELAKLQVA